MLHYPISPTQFVILGIISIVAFTFDLVMYKLLEKGYFN